jgi:uncharacterized protein
MEIIGEGMQSEIVRIILIHYPDTQAVYLFGSFSTADEWPDSDLDIGLLLPPLQAKNTLFSALDPCSEALADYSRRDIDLINIRQVSTVFQKEITTTGRLLYCADQYATDEFEMLVLSYYQKLNEERQEILNSFLQTGRAYNV